MKALLCAVFLVTAPAEFADTATSVQLRALLAGREKFQHWFFKYFLVLAGCCFLCGRLLADPLPTLTATSASVSSDLICPTGVCTATIFASGDSFGLEGSSYGGVNRTDLPDFLFPIDTSFSISGTVLGGVNGRMFVDGRFEGTYVVYYGSAAVGGAPFLLGCPSPETTQGCTYSPTITVSAEGGAITAPPITPSSPSTTLVLPADIGGSFSGTACDPNVLPFCDTPPRVVGNVSINLPGQLTVHLDAFYFNGGATPYVSRLTVREDFVSTPEPASILLIALGLAAVSAIVLRRKPRPICDTLVSNSNSNAS